MLGQVIKHNRTKKAISTKELAKELGVTETSVRYWELGIRTPKLDHIKQMSKLFGIDVEELTQYL